MDTNSFDHRLIAKSVVECEGIEVQIKYAALVKEKPPKNELEAVRLLLQARDLTCTKEVRPPGSINELIGVRDPYPDDDGIPITPHIIGLLWILLCAGAWTFLGNHKWVPMNFWSHLCVLAFVSVTAHIVFTQVQKKCD